MKNKAIFCVLALFVLAAVILTYSNHFHNAFHFDDSHVVVNNIYIKSLRNIPLFFKNAATISSVPTNQAYRPIVVTSLALDYYMGKGLNPFYFHLSMFILFIVQGFFMYLLYLKIFDLSQRHKWNSLAALLAVAWYMLHPANAETINYITARSDLISTLFVVISLVMFAYSSFCRRWYLYFIPFALGMLTKPVSAAFVLLLFAYLLYFEGKCAPTGKKDAETTKGSAIGQALKKTAPSFLFCLLLILFTKKMTPATFAPGGAPFFNYVITQPYVILHYFTSFFLPIGLSADTDWKPSASMSDPRFLAGALFLAILLFAAVAVSRYKKTLPISFGILWFFIALLPTSLFPLAEVMNDHRIFFPFVGLMMSVCWSLALVFSKVEKSLKSASVFNHLASAIILILLTFYAYGTHERNKVWRTEETLWRDVTEKSPKNGRGQMNYGVQLMGKGDFGGAETHFIRALEFTPTYSHLHLNLGVLMENMGRTAEAEQYFRNAIFLNPDHPASHFYYGRFLKTLGRYIEAAEHLNRALELSPAHMDARRLLMSIYLDLDNIAGLRELAQQTLLIAPYDRSAAFYLNYDLEKAQKRIGTGR